MKVFHASKRATVGVLAASVLSSVLGLAPSASAAVYEPCNSHDLRDAVHAANASIAVTDTIILNPKCKYTFTMGDVSGGDPNSALVVTDPLVIAGNGATIKITGNADLRHILSAADLTLNNVTLTGGRIESPYTPAPSLTGGSIVMLAGDLRGDKLTVKDNKVTAVGGAAIAAAGGIVVGPGAGDVTLVRSAITDNKVNVYGLSAQAVVGGIVNSGGGAMSITRSLVTGNEVNASSLTVTDSVAGGIAQSFGGGGFALTDSTVSGNRVSARGLQNLAAGGGVYVADGVSTFSNNTVSGNTVTADGPVSLAIGGGIFNAGDLSDSGSTISGNKAVCKSSGFCLAAGGGYANLLQSSAAVLGPGSATFDGTTFTGNKAEAKHGAAAGGGLAVAGNTTVLTEATVTKNEAKGALQLGGGIANFGDVADVEIDSSDVVKNKPTNCYNVPACEY
jgi:hypothetical protein